MNQKTPQHVAIIMDGNGRWAKQQGLSRFEGHCAGAETLRMIIRACADKNIPMLSAFAFGMENWKRPQDEVDGIMRLFVDTLEARLDELYEEGVRICFIGDRAQLSQVIQDKMASSEALTQGNQRVTLNVVMNYSGRWDIVQAAQAIARQVKKGELSPDAIDEALFDRHLATSFNHEPDLLIRTSGEQRVSNYFLWQLAYTEIYFTERYWPEFTLEEFEKALLFFSSRERRFGKVSEQLDESVHV